ncbi:hypothetical protein FB451DRAFT_590148 [Mycena latifolia]|nr:hypothetical protein FB451DRAFT_590148 [Mycena latifolia]
MAYVAVPLALPVMQDALRQPEKWNSDWEKITQTVDRLQSPSDLVHLAAIQLTMDSARMDSSFMEYQTLLGRLCHVQAWLTTDVILDSTRDDLEAKWMNASPELRGKHILIGFSNVCSIAKNLHDARLYCGRELRLSHLRKDGRAVLDLLDAVIVEGTLKVPDQPRYIPHPGWNALTESQQRSAPTDVEKLALANILLLRTKLICHILHFTLRSFVGEKLPEITVMKHRKKNPTETFPTKAFSEAFREHTLGPAGAKAAAKDDKDAWKERQSKRKEHCSYTGCFKANNDSAIKYPRCKKCWEAMQREVLYCSVECQKADWKLNHKAICGKPLTFDAVAKPVLAPRLNAHPPATIGPPVEGYKRSRALTIQIAALTQLPKLDYLLIVSSDNSINIDFPDPEAQSLFRKCREKAMTTGDRPSIATMAHFLCWMTLEDPHCISKGATSNVIVNQLKKEYRYDELHLAVTEMQQRQNRDQFKRPYVLAFGIAPVPDLFVQRPSFRHVSTELDEILQRDECQSPGCP